MWLWPYCGGIGNERNVRRGMRGNIVTTSSVNVINKTGYIMRRRRRNRRRRRSRRRSAAKCEGGSASRICGGGRAAAIWHQARGETGACSVVTSACAGIRLLARHRVDARQRHVTSGDLENYGEGAGGVAAALAYIEGVSGAPASTGGVASAAACGSLAAGGGAMAKKSGLEIRGEI